MGNAATRLGEVLNDAYELHELLSSSSELEIYRGTDRRTRTGVLIKLLRPEVALKSGVVEGFLRRPRSLSEVSHASLPLVRVDTDDTGIPFVVEETVEGRTLSSLIESFPQGLPAPLLEQLALSLAEALALAHAHRMVHGAIDAAHVKLIGPPHAPAPKLIGLGAARDELGEQDVAYRAPELDADAQLVPNARCDVFAFGVLLYQMLCGELPYRSGKKSAVPLDEIAPQLPAAWVTLTGACLEALPERRLADAGKLLERLRGCTSSGAAQAKAKAEQEAKTKAKAKAEQEAKAKAKAEQEAKAKAERDKRAAASAAKPQAAPAAKPNDNVLNPMATAATVFAMEAPKPLEPPAEKRAPAAPKPLEPPAEKRAPAAPKPVEPPAEKRTMADVASAFGPLAEGAPLTDDADKKSVKDAKDAKDKKKHAAKEASEKLKSKGAKTAPKADAQDKDKDKDKDKDRPSKVEARKGVEAGEARVETFEPRKKPDRPEPAAARAQPAGAKAPGPTQGQIAAAALTDAQLNALRAMRTEDPEKRDRWVGLFFMVLFMLLLQLGMPLLYEKQLTRAHELFGARTTIAGGVFMVVTLIATARVWAAQIKGGSIVQKITSYAMQLVAASIIVVSLTLYTQSPAIAMAAGVARKALPWGTSFLFFMFAFDLGMRGAGQLAGNMLYGALVLMLSCGSLYGSYHAMFTTLLKDRKQLAAALEEARRRRELGDDSDGVLPGSAEELKKQLSDKTTMADWQEQHQDVNTMKQRKQVGASEEDDLRSADELLDTRNKNKQALDKLQQALPAPTDPTTGEKITE